MSMNNKWSYYAYKNRKIVCLNPPPEKTKEEIQEELNLTMFQISLAIERKRNKYIKPYDETHGDGAYERLYYLKNIYDNLDDFGDDEDEDNYEDVIEEE